jgi:hypothetical protein
MAASIDSLLCDKTRPSRTPSLPKAVIETVVTRTLRESPPAGVTHQTRRWPRPAAQRQLGVADLTRAARAPIRPATARPH